MARNIEFDRKHAETFVALMEGCTEDYIYYWDFKNDYYYISESAAIEFDLPVNGFNNVTEVLKKVIYPQDFKLVDEDVYRIIHEGQNTHDMEYRWVSRHGEILWISCRGNVIRENDNSAAYLIGRITQLGRTQKADNLTGLLRENVLEECFAEAVSLHKSGYIMKIGIDNFKAINEKYGMTSGDIVLKNTTEYLNEVAKEYEVRLFKLQGDELAVFSASDSGYAEAAVIYNKLKRIIESSAKDTDYKIFYTVSAGVVEYPVQSSDYSELQRYAEFALNSAKRGGRNNIELFSSESYRKYIEKIDLQEKLRKDVAADFENFEVFYQPVVDIETGMLSGAEALLRWKDKETGSYVPPYRFIPILEESGLIIPVGRWVLKNACNQCAEWKKAIPEFKINVNVSYVQIKKSDIFSDVWKCVNDAGLKENAIVLELTESGYIDTDDAIKKIIESFREQNIKVALDDFGTGYSNLRYLKELQVDTLKIDRSFVCKALQEEYDYELIKNIISMAHSINLKVCLEGVETEEELDALSMLFPDYIQGYLFGRPVNAAQFYNDNILKMLS